MIERVLATMIVIACVAETRVVSAQGVEITPFAGSEVGVSVDVPLPDGFQFEGFFSRGRQGPVTVDQWQAGGLQEFGGWRLRPFLTGTLGATRYAVEPAAEFRFALTAGGGIKVFPSRRIALRLEGRVFATFLDGGGTAVACSPGWCLFALHADVDWRAECTAGISIKFR